MAAAFNPRAPSVRRIMQELREVAADDNPDVLAEAIEDNIFEWHFVIRGAWDTEYEGGIYHGRILMPAEYPFKPPAFVMLTPSGRFETGTRICLSISSHHPESWQPSWSVRSALVALIAFMQTPGGGAVGSLDAPPEARRALAAESRGKPPKYGSAERQAMIKRMHEHMLELEPGSRALYKREAAPVDGDGATGTSGDAGAEAAPAGAEAAAAEAVPMAAASPDACTTVHAGEPAAASMEGVTTPLLAGAPPVVAEPAQPASQLQHRPAAAVVQQVQQPAALPAFQPQQQLQVQAQAVVQQQSWEDRGLTLLALVLVALIAALLLRRLLAPLGLGRGQDLGFDPLGSAADLEL